MLSRLGFLAACAVGVLLNSVAASAQTGSPLVTREPDNGLESGQPSAFFDLIVGAESLTIYGWDYYSFGLSGEVSIFYKEGSYVGFDTDPSAWTLHGTAFKAGGFPASALTPTLWVDPLPLEAGKTYGICFRAEKGGLRYEGTSGAPPKTTYVTGDLTLKGGIVRTAPFGGSLFNPRVWSGAIYYSFNPIVSNFGARAARGGGALFGDGYGTGYKAFGFRMTGDYALDAVALGMTFYDPSPDVRVSLWSGFSQPQAQLVALNNPPGLSGAGDFEFTSASPFLLRKGKTYWVRVATGTPGAGARFAWHNPVGGGVHLVPTGPGASPIGFVRDGSPSVLTALIEVRGELVGSPLVTGEPNNGLSSGQPGAFFDLIVGAEPLVVTGWDYYAQSPAGTPTRVSIFYKNRSYVGFDTVPSAWTLHGTASGVSAGPASPVSLKTPTPLALEAGRTYGICFRAENGGLRYQGTSGAPPTTTYATLHLILKGGIVRTEPFGGLLFDPRVWSGAIHYEHESGCYPDCDGSTKLDFFDFLCFQNAFAAADPYADCDDSGQLDFFDFLCFQNAFAAGCP